MQQKQTCLLFFVQKSWNSCSFPIWDEAFESLQILLISPIKSFLNFFSVPMSIFVFMKISLNFFCFSGSSTLALSSTPEVFADRGFLDGAGTTSVVNF